jgi:hypothetical protein
MRKVALSPRSPAINPRATIPAFSQPIKPFAVWRNQSQVKIGNIFQVLLIIFLSFMKG